MEHRCGAISLLGGEPLLHPQIEDIIRIVRREFPLPTELIILTNGVRLPYMPDSFWKTLKQYNVQITVTVYPIRLDYIAIEKKAHSFGIPIGMSSNIHADRMTMDDKISDKHTLDPKGKVPEFYFANCLYFNKFNVLKDGRLYMCPVAAHIDILNKAFGLKFKLRPGDSLDIYKIKDWKEVADFTSKRVPFCDYCDLKKWHHDSVWKSSNKKVSEYI